MPAGEKRFRETLRTMKEDSFSYLDAHLEYMRDQFPFGELQYNEYMGENDEDWCSCCEDQIADRDLFHEWSEEVREKDHIQQWWQNQYRHWWERANGLPVQYCGDIDCGYCDAWGSYYDDDSYDSDEYFDDDYPDRLRDAGEWYKMALAREEFDVECYGEYSEYYDPYEGYGYDDYEPFVDEDEDYSFSWPRLTVAAAWQLRFDRGRRYGEPDAVKCGILRSTRQARRVKRRGRRRSARRRGWLYEREYVPASEWFGPYYRRRYLTLGEIRAKHGLGFRQRSAYRRSRGRVEPEPVEEPYLSWLWWSSKVNRPIPLKQSAYTRHGVRR